MRVLRHVQLHAVLVLAVTFLPGSVVSLQAQTAGKEITRVDLGLDVSTAGGKAMVPILLQAPAGVEIGATVNEITFATDIVTFVEVTLGDAGETADVGIETDVLPVAGDPNKSVVRIRLTGKNKAIPTGTVASVVFALAKNAPTGSVVLRNVPKAFTFGGSPQPVAAIEGVDGEIQVGAPPVISCFFYMH